MSRIWIGQAVSALVTLVLLLDAGTMLFAPASLADTMRETGWPMSLAPTLGIITLACAIVYAVPQTAVLGAVLVTGFSAAAIGTHLRLGQVGSPPQLICLTIAVLAWAGLWLRDPRVRALLPLSFSASIHARAPNSR